MTTTLNRHTRRQFLKRGGALGLASSLPAMLASCGGTDDHDNAPKPAQGARELRDLHFDLSGASATDLTLFAPRSAQHGAALKPHTADTLRDLRGSTPGLAGVPDSQLTHYLKQVDLPAAALQAVLVRGRHPTTGAALLCAAHIHVPRKALAAVAARAAGKGVRREASAKSQAYGMTINALSADDLVAANSFSTPLDIASFLVFHHPEVMNLDATKGAEILQRVEHLPCDPADSTCTPYLGALAFKIATLIGAHGYPSTTPGSWATLVPQTQLDGTPVLDDKGATVYRYDLNDDVAEFAKPVIQKMLYDIFNDDMFEGSNWHAIETTAIQPATPETSVAAAGDVFGVVASQPVGTARHGIHTVKLEVTDPTTRSVRLTVRNQYLRCLSTYVQFRDANGTTLPVRSPSSLDTSQSSYLTLVSTNDQIMGIPFQGDTVSTTEVEFTMPSDAAVARIMFGSLGLGGQAFTQEALPGSLLTLGLNIGLPFILLAIGVGSDVYTVAKNSILDLFKDVTLGKLLIKAMLGGLKGSGSDFAEGIYSSASSLSVQPFITGTANVVIQTLLSEAPTIAAKLAEAILTAGLLQTSLGFFGIGLKLLAIIGDAAAIAVTVSEVCLNPAISENLIALTMTSTVTVAKDARDFQFPAAARSYTIDMYYDGGKVPKTAKGTLEQGRTDPIVATFGDVASGGKVTVHVSLYADNGCLVGSKVSDPIDNLPATATAINLEIVEVLAPLNSSTHYDHKLKLTYANGVRTWAEAAAPSATQPSLCQGGDKALCELNGLTVHTASGMAGYGFKAGGQGVTFCGSSDTGVLHTLQNVFLGNNPERALKFSGCGYADPIGIVYDPLGPAVGGHHFFLQPDADGFFHVRSLVLDDSTSIDMNQTTSWGRFSNPLDSLTVMPSGYLVGVNRIAHQMEVLLLPAAPSDQFVPDSIPFAALKGGQGRRPGLLDTPVAVASARGALLILEQGNTRIQALDVGGAIVKLFKNNTSNLITFDPEATAVYLDIAVEGKGYMFVLSHVNNGQTPADYRLDCYTPNGDHLFRNTGVAAPRISMDLFRNLYTLNYEVLKGSPRTEPSLSQWSPSLDNGCGTAATASALRHAGSTCMAPRPA